MRRLTIEYFRVVLGENDDSSVNKKVNNIFFFSQTECETSFNVYITIKRFFVRKISFYIRGYAYRETNRYVVQL